MTPKAKPENREQMERLSKNSILLLTVRVKSTITNLKNNLLYIY